MFKRTALVVILGFLPWGATPAAAKPRARDLGVPFGGTPGKWNAITDVPGVWVGHETIIHGDAKTPPGKGPARTGVTAILPFGKKTGLAAQAGFFSMNGNGELTGTTWLDEGGLLESVIVFTNTHSVGVARDAVVKWSLKPGVKYEQLVSLPVVGETWDGDLNDINGFHVKDTHVFKALDGAATGPVAEGSVGGGTGMVCFEFKCGIGTASRKVTVPKAGTYTVGVIVQANFGLREQLLVAGVPVGAAMPIPKAQPKKTQESGSILVAIATDAPLLPHQLKRVARRATVGLARTGSISGNGSGDIFLAFSTAEPMPMGAHGVRTVPSLANADLDPIFAATAEGVEESIINALVAGETMTGAGGKTVNGIPHGELRTVMEKAGRLGPKAAR